MMGRRRAKAAGMMDLPGRTAIARARFIGLTVRTCFVWPG
jgi:hypothetical protein